MFKIVRTSNRRKNNNNKQQQQQQKNNNNKQQQQQNNKGKNNDPRVMAGDMKIGDQFVIKAPFRVDAKLPVPHQIGELNGGHKLITMQATVTEGPLKGTTVTLNLSAGDRLHPYGETAKRVGLIGSIVLWFKGLFTPNKSAIKPLSKLPPKLPPTKG